MPCASCACVVSTPPTSTALTRWPISSSVSRSPSSSAWIRYVIRSSRRVALALLDQVVHVGHELGRRLLERGQHRRDRDRVELLLDQVRPVPELRSVLERRAHHARDHPRGVRLRERVDEVARAVGRDRVPHLLELLAHERPQLVGLLGREGVLDQLALPAVVVAAQVEQVALHPVPHRALGDALHLEHQDAREVRLRRAHEERDRLVVEHDPADRVGARDPRLARASPSITSWKRGPVIVSSV